MVSSQIRVEAILKPLGPASESIRVSFLDSRSGHLARYCMSNLRIICDNPFAASRVEDIVHAGAR